MLIGFVGLPGTVAVAGWINLALALIVWLICRNNANIRITVHKPAARIHTADTGGLYPGFLMAAGITGAASFMYEIGWIRMLNLVLGSSTHAFELMLSAFILGLALGGWWIRGRIDSIGSPLIALGWIQILMAVFALSTLLIYGNTFEFMQYIMLALDRTDEGYTLFNLLSHGLAMLIMLPTTICAGMTLPLLTYYLFNQGFGERAIGGIYAANTLGAIIGIVLSVQWIMPHLGVKNVIVSGAGLDMVLGLIFFLACRPAGFRKGEGCDGCNMLCSVFSGRARVAAGSDKNDIRGLSLRANTHQPGINLPSRR